MATSGYAASRTVLIPSRVNAMSTNTSPAELQKVFDRQRSAFAADPYPALEARLRALGSLRAVCAAISGKIGAALRADFGSHETSGCCGSSVVHSHVSNTPIRDWQTTCWRERRPAVHMSTPSRSIRVFQHFRSEESATAEWEVITASKVSKRSRTRVQSIGEAP
jgi:hypothetical protein